jgi:hypothetical protein
MSFHMHDGSGEARAGGRGDAGEHCNNTVFHCLSQFYKEFLACGG